MQVSFWKKYKSYLISGVSLILILVLLHFVGEILLPFVFALFLAHLINPVVQKIQKRIPNRNLAVTALIVPSLLLFIGSIIFLGAYIINDTTRLVKSVDVFVEHHEVEINKAKNDVSNFFGEIYESEEVQSQLEASTETAEKDGSKDLTAALESVYMFFKDSDAEPEDEKPRSWNGVLIILYTLLYLFPILYTYDYFDEKYKKYFSEDEELNGTVMMVWVDFKNTFLTYFKQRSKIMLICSMIFIVTFLLMDLPGAIILGALAGVLTYAAHFHYLALPPIAIGCWVLSIENNHSFMLYFGIALGVFILISILEETIFFNKIMKSVAGMNPAIMILSFTLWIYIFGGFIGTLLALPLTSLILIYMDRILLYSAEHPSVLRSALTHKKETDSEK